MITVEEIIRKKANPEGYHVNQEDLGDFLVKKLSEQYVFQYKSTVITVDKKKGTCHIYSVGGYIRKAMRKFMNDVWKNSEFKTLEAPILNKKLQRIVQAFGWKPTEIAFSTGHILYRIERT